MSMTWQGFDIDGLQLDIRAWADKIELDARQILDDIVREAVDDMYQILLNAVTDTGLRRAAAGEGAGVAGRVDTGQMARDIKAALDADLDGAIVAEWGWIDNVENYYVFQEYGNQYIKAMSALQGSYMKAREKLRQRLADMGLEVR